MIEISVNGEIKEIKEHLNVFEFIELFGYKDKGVAVAINTTFVPISEYKNVIIKDGDKIDILGPVQGG